MPPVPPASPSLDRARKIVAKGLCELKRDVEVWPFGKDGNVLCFTTDEREQLKIVRDRVSSYCGSLITSGRCASPSWVRRAAENPPA